MPLCHNPGYHRFKPRLPSCQGNKIIHTTQHKKASGAKLICLFYFVPLTMSKLWSHLLFQQGWFSFFLQAMAGPHHYFLTMKAEENKILTITHLSLLSCCPSSASLSVSSDCSENSVILSIILNNRDLTSETKNCQSSGTAPVNLKII